MLVRKSIQLQPIQPIQPQHKLQLDLPTNPNSFKLMERIMCIDSPNFILFFIYEKGGGRGAQIKKISCKKDSK